MIPKVIHYCWFGGATKSAFIKKCMQTWKEKLPDYEWKEWNENTFDVNSVPFVREAYKAKKWAFVADYVRLYALYTEGGIYMDSDVKVLKSLDEFLKYDFFSSHEKHPSFYTKEEQEKIDKKTLTLKDTNNIVNGFCILSALMGSIAYHPYLKDCLSFYNSLSFNIKDNNIKDYIIGKLITKFIFKYGYKYKDENQFLENNIAIFKSNYFVGNTIYLDNNAYAIHLCNGSWLDNTNTFNYKLRNNYPYIYPCYSLILQITRKIKRIINI